MPDWCPKCNAMLVEGTQVCPRCGTSLGVPINDEDAELNRKTVIWYSLYTIGVALGPIIIILCIGLLCVFLFLRQ
jgi:hypothetical protein